ncbi:hypothetical protein POM88_015182 [Heracleum sosnowskyi]|uniref:Uncharacterized protein n=1 Tax=Heracleum sosnowskyi TaxID=360622 RepID=A0AAD8MVW5_9APIA|nr:hypothetical protein POM88_015182 [Heracleum sosnowskyi]
MEILAQPEIYGLTGYKSPGGPVGTGIYEGRDGAPGMGMYEGGGGQFKLGVGGFFGGGGGGGGDGGGGLWLQVPHLISGDPGTSSSFLGSNPFIGARRARRARIVASKDDMVFVVLKY